jgi:hypothetical protein
MVDVRGVRNLFCYTARLRKVLTETDGRDKEKEWGKGNTKEKMKRLEISCLLAQTEMILVKEERRSMGRPWKRWRE